MDWIVCPSLKCRYASQYRGFGSKSEPHSIYIVAIQAARLTGLPVKMFHSRDEEFTSSRTRHPEILYLKTGLKRDGTITARLLELPAHDHFAMLPGEQRPSAELMRSLLEWLKSSR